MDWEDTPGTLTTETDSPGFQDNVVVMPTPHEDSWHGLWAFDGEGGHEEFFGDKPAVIAWAKERSATVRVWSEALQDLELL